MASADFSAPSFRRYRRPWPFRAGVEISRNKTHFFRSAGCGFTTLLRLGLGLRLASQTCPQVGLVSASCAYPPNFASGFLHPRPHGRKLALGYLVPPNWPIGDLHSRPCVMSCIHRVGGVATPPLTPRGVPLMAPRGFLQRVIRGESAPFPRTTCCSWLPPLAGIPTSDTTPCGSWRVAKPSIREVPTS